MGLVVVGLASWGTIYLGESIGLREGIFLIVPLVVVASIFILEAITNPVASMARRRIAAIEFGDSLLLWKYSTNCIYAFDKVPHVLLPRLLLDVRELHSYSLGVWNTSAIPARPKLAAYGYNELLRPELEDFWAQQKRIFIREISMPTCGIASEPVPDAMLGTSGSAVPAAPSHSTLKKLLPEYRTEYDYTGNRWKTRFSLVS
jgi:hypothetical protein